MNFGKHILNESRDSLCGDPLWFNNVFFSVPIKTEATQALGSADTKYSMRREWDSNPR